MSLSLQPQHCVPCTGKLAPLQRSESLQFVAEVSGWVLDEENKSIWREFAFKDFQAALAFINRVGELAESEGHHPDIHCWWNKVKLVLTTHAIGGLSNNDFVMASKINKL